MIHKLKANLKAAAEYTRIFLRGYWLTSALILLFVIQTHLFFLLLRIPVQPYFIRRSIIAGALGALVFSPAVLLDRWKKYLYLLAGATSLAVIFSFQFLYCDFSGGFLQASALLQTHEGVSILSTAKLFLSWRLFFFWLGPLGVGITWFLARHQKIQTKILTKRQKIRVAITVIILVLAGYGYVFLREDMESHDVKDLYQFDKLYDIEALVSKIGIINFSLGDIFTLKLAPPVATPAQIKEVNDFMAAQAITDTSTKSMSVISDFGLAKGRNLIFIQVESLENAVIKQKIYDQEITPNLNRLADQGLYFSHYYSPIGPGTTADAEFMTLNSLYALPDTVAFIQYAYDHYTALPDLLKNNGYHTYSLHGDVSSFWNRANVYPQLGYEQWFDRKDFTIPRAIGAYDLGDKDFFAQVLPILKTLPQPFMATLITLSSHIPFQLPTDLETMNLPAAAKLTWFQRHYLQSIHYTDQAIGDFITRLKAAGLDDDSLIFIFGDHGSFSGISQALKFNNSVFPEMQTAEVPLIILAPGLNLRGQRDFSASHLDVYPTAANLLGLETPPDIFGHDLVAGKNIVTVNRRLISGTIADLVSQKLAYQSDKSGIFANGTCLSMPGKKPLAAAACQPLFDQTSQAVQVSDLLVKKNLITTNTNHPNLQIKN